MYPRGHYAKNRTVIYTNDSFESLRKRDGREKIGV